MITIGERKYLEPDVETLSRDELKGAQEKRLYQQLIYAYENAPLYKWLYDKEGVNVYKIRTIGDFKKYIPLVDKDIVREFRERTGDIFGGTCCLPINYFAASEDNPYAGRVYRSTGTTGRPTAVIYTDKDLKIGCLPWARMWWAQGLRPGDKCLDYVDFAYHPATRFLGLAFRKIGVIIYREQLEQWALGLEMSKLLDINHIWTTTIPLRPITQKLEQEGKSLKDYFPNLKAVTQTGEISETLLKYYHSEICKVPIVNCYAVSETGFVGFSCLEQGEPWDSLHMPEDLYYMEHINPRTGEDVLSGLGEIVFTNLYFESMAYIRWRSEDWAEVNYDPCICGRTHARARFFGRLSESVSVKEKLITNREVEDVVHSFPESRFQPCQLVREEPQPQDQLKLRVTYKVEMVKEPEQFRLKVEKKFQQELGVDTVVELINPEEVRSLGHKFLRVVTLPKKV